MLIAQRRLAYNKSRPRASGFGPDERWLAASVASDGKLCEAAAHARGLRQTWVWNELSSETIKNLLLHKHPQQYVLNHSNKAVALKNLHVPLCDGISSESIPCTPNRGRQVRWNATRPNQLCCCLCFSPSGFPLHCVSAPVATCSLRVAAHTHLSLTVMSGSIFWRQISPPPPNAPCKRKCKQLHV